ncbi:sulfatase-like hydrolase/transferase [Clostridium sp.]
MDNILFIYTDQWRADCVGYHNHPTVKTPNLDTLAGISADFCNSHTTTPLCTPARGIMMTGLMPHESGVIDNCDVGASTQAYLPSAAHTWLDATAQVGYKTGYFGKWHLGADWYTDDKNIEFDLCRKEGNAERHLCKNPTGPATERGELVPGVRKLRGLSQIERSQDKPPFYEKIESIETRMEYAVTNKALEFLEKSDNEPWCLTASFVGPHFPSSIPEPYFSMYDYKDIELPSNLNDRFLNKPWYQNRHWWPTMITDDFTEENWKRTAAAYYGAITMIDDLIGKLLKSAKEHSGGRKTRVIFTSDHGEMLGAHSRFDKGSYFYEEVMRTPLLVCPDLNGTQSGIVRHEYCSTPDIAKTFFEFANEDVGCGKSLLPLLDPEYSDNREDVVYGSYYKYNGHSFEVRCIKTPKYKYSFVPQDIDELYDIENDPFELINVSDNDEYREIKSELKEKLFKHMHENGDYLLKIMDELPRAGIIGAPEYPAMKMEYSR